MPGYAISCFQGHPKGIFGFGRHINLSLSNLTVNWSLLCHCYHRIQQFTSFKTEISSQYIFLRRGHKLDMLEIEFWFCKLCCKMKKRKKESKKKRNTLSTILLNLSLTGSCSHLYKQILHFCTSVHYMYSAAVLNFIRTLARPNVCPVFTEKADANWKYLLSPVKNNTGNLCSGHTAG